MIDLVYDCLSSVGAVPKRRVRPQISLTKMNSTALPGGSLVSLVFVENAETPHYVVRIPRDPRQDERLRANYSTLLALHKSPELRGTVPQPIFAGNVKGVLLTIETCLHGSQMARELLNARRENAPNEEIRLLAIGWEWLAKLHRATRRELPQDFLSTRRALLETETAFLQQHGILTASEARRLRESVGELLDLPLPYSRCHADFNPNNALRPFDDPTGFYGFDFEFSRNTVSLFDVFEWARSGWLCLPGTPIVSQEENNTRLSQLWLQTHPLGQSFHATLSEYASAMGVASGDLRPLFAGHLAVALAAKLQSPLGDQSPDLPTWQNALHYEIKHLN